MDLSRGVFDESLGIMILNDRLGSLYVYDFESLKRVYASRDEPRLRSPYIRRSVARMGDGYLYSDGRSSFLFHPPDSLVPLDYPAGKIVAPGLICGETSYFEIRSGDVINVARRITACDYQDRPLVATFMNGNAYFENIRIRRDIITTIKDSRIGTHKGLLLDYESGISIEINGSVRDIREAKDALYVVARRDSKTSIYAISHGSVEDRIVLRGRFNALIEAFGERYVIGERIEKIEL